MFDGLQIERYFLLADAGDDRLLRFLWNTGQKP
jgi:hypothetical protein